MATYNYLLINENGNSFWYESNDYTNVLKKYITDHLGYHGVFKLDMQAWNELAAATEEKNAVMTKLFNALCSDPGLRIKKALWYFQLIYPSVTLHQVGDKSKRVHKFFIATEGGNIFEIAGDDCSLSDILNSYISGSLENNDGVKVDKIPLLGCEDIADPTADGTVWSYVNNVIPTATDDLTYGTHVNKSNEDVNNDIENLEAKITAYNTAITNYNKDADLYKQTSLVLKKLNEELDELLNKDSNTEEEAAELARQEQNKRFDIAKVQESIEKLKSDMGESKSEVDTALSGLKAAWEPFKGECHDNTRIKAFNALNKLDKNKIVAVGYAAALPIYPKD